jgi:hypothetical protein
MREALPFLVQGFVMSVDEIFFHRRREMRRWERIGHPLDTLFYALCLGFLLFMPVSPNYALVYAALAAGSCLFITKDEWQHARLCTPFENWLHSLLFILHPAILIWAGYLWWNASEEFRPVVGAFALLSLGFALYQTIYWNFWRRD